MIRKLHVTNFKSLKDVTLDLGLRNVLVGPNMAGKSNLVSVFRFLAHMVAPPSPGTYGLVSAFADAGGFGDVRWRGANSQLITFELEGDFPRLEDDGEAIRWRYLLEVLGSARGPLIVQNEFLGTASSRGGAHLIKKDPDTGQRLIQNLDGSTVSTIADKERSALEFELPGWDGDRLRHLFGLARFYQLIPRLMREVNQTSAAFWLDREGRNLSSWLMTIFTKHRDDFDKIGAAARSVFPELERLYPFPTPQSQVFVASSEKGLLTDVPLWQMSDGELCFIALASLIFAPPQLAAPLYCIEEPENYLHPRLLDAAIELLRQEQMGRGHHAAQVIATTHSPKLVDKTGIDELIVVEKRDGATTCRRPTSSNNLRELLDEAGLGDLYYSGALASG